MAPSVMLSTLFSYQLLLGLSSWGVCEVAVTSLDLDTMAQK